MHAYNSMFVISFWILIGVMVLAQFMPDRAKATAMQERLAAERGALRAGGYLAESAAVMEA